MNWRTRFESEVAARLRIRKQGLLVIFAVSPRPADEDILGKRNCSICDISSITIENFSPPFVYRKFSVKMTLVKGLL